MRDARPGTTSKRRPRKPDPGLTHRQQQIVHNARELIQAPSGSARHKAAAERLAHLNMNDHEHALANRAAAQHQEHLRRMGTFERRRRSELASLSRREERAPSAFPIVARGLKHGFETGTEQAGEISHHPIRTGRELKAGMEMGLEEAQHPRQVAKDLTGIDPRHPLSEGPAWFGVNALSALPIIHGPKFAAEALRAAREGEGAVDVLRAGTRGARTKSDRALTKFKRSKAGRQAQAELKAHPVRAEVHRQIEEAPDLRPREKQNLKRHFDNEVHRAVQQSGKTVDELLHDPRVQEALAPFHGYAPERTAANLRSKLNPRMAERGLPGNAALRHEGQHVLGPILPEEWVARVVHTMPGADERRKWAKWYDEVLPLFQHTFGDDATRVLRGFAVSQANASPTSGLQAVFRVIDKVDRGEPIADNEISAVVKSIENAVKGEPVSKGVAAKLSDFIDSLLSRDTRTWMGHAPEGGAPSAIDVHALRDLGYVDPKIVSRLEQRGLKQGEDFVVDNPGVAKGPMYERAAEQYQTITDYLNQIRFDGRADWKPAEVQALGWASIQKFHGASPEDLHVAIANNTRTVSAEVSGFGRFGTTEFPSLDTRTVPYEEGLRVTQHVIEETVPELAEAARVRVRGIDYGPGGYRDDITPSAQIHVLGSPEQVERFRDLVGVTLHQWEVWAVKPGRTGSLSKAAIELHAPEFSDPARVESFWRKLHEIATPQEQEALAGFAPFKADDGSDWIRIITPTGYRTPDKVQSFMDKYTGVLERAAKEEGLDVRAAFNHVEVRAGESGDVGESYLERLSQSVPDARGVVDRANATADAAFRDAVSGGSTGDVPRTRRSDGLASGFDPGFHDDTERGLLGDWFHRIRGGDEGDFFPGDVESVSPETEADIAALDKAQEGLKGAAKTEREQAALRREEVAKRVDLAEEAMRGAQGLEDKIRAAKTELQGALPKLQHQGVRGLTEAEADRVAELIEAHPDLRFFERIRAMDAFRNAWAVGQLPTKSELKLLKRALGPDITAATFNKGGLHKIARGAFEITNMPRSLMASFDISAPFRQGLVAFARHPLMTGRNLGPMLKYLGSETGYQDLMRGIDLRPNRDLYAKAGLAITDVEHSLEHREEQFMSNLAERMTGKKITTAEGHTYYRSPVRMSGRAYTGFLVKTRADMFDYLIEAAEKAGHDVDDPKLLKDLGNYINAATGRGSLGNLEGAAVALNSTFFSPRLMASRLTFLWPPSYVKLHPFVRRQKLRAAIQLATAVGAVLYLGHLGGAKVGLDPFSADFGKLKFGDTRVDISGGFAGYLRALGTVGMATTGHDPDKKTIDTLTRFFRGKLAPIPGFGVDVATHTDYSGYRTPDLPTEVRNLFTPLIVQDTMKVIQNKDSLPKVAATAAASAVGFGVNTYKDKPKSKPGPTEDDFTAKYQEKFGRPLPLQVQQAQETKEMYADAEKRRKDELGVTKLTEEQRVYVKLAVLASRRPDLRPAIRNFRGMLDQGSNPEATSFVEGWAEDSMNWPMLEQFHSILKEASGK